MVVPAAFSWDSRCLALETYFTRGSPVSKRRADSSFLSCRRLAWLLVLNRPARVSHRVLAVVQSLKIPRCCSARYRPIYSCPCLGVARTVSLTCCLGVLPQPLGGEHTLHTDTPDMVVVQVQTVNTDSACGVLHATGRGSLAPDNRQAAQNTAQDSCQRLLEVAQISLGTDKFRQSRQDHPPGIIRDPLVRTEFPWKCWKTAQAFLAHVFKVAVVLQSLSYCLMLKAASIANMPKRPSAVGKPPRRLIYGLNQIS